MDNFGVVAQIIPIVIHLRSYPQAAINTNVTANAAGSVDKLNLDNLVFGFQHLKIQILLVGQKISFCIADNFCRGTIFLFVDNSLIVSYDM